MCRNFFLIRVRRRVVSPLCQALIGYLIKCAQKGKNKHVV